MLTILFIFMLSDHIPKEYKIRPRGGDFIWGEHNLAKIDPKCAAPMSNTIKLNGRCIFYLGKIDLLVSLSIFPDGPPGLQAVFKGKA